MINNEFIDLVEDILSASQKESDVNGRYYQPDVDWGMDIGYVSALEDLLIFLKDESKNGMNRPHLYFNVTYNYMHRYTFPKPLKTEASS